MNNFKKTVDFINLPEGGENAGFDIEELRNYIKSTGNSLVVGNTHLVLSKHKKPISLDFWCRKHKSVSTAKKDTCQALKSVVRKIISYNDFALQVKKCPKTKKSVYTLILIN